MSEQNGVILFIAKVKLDPSYPGLEPKHFKSVDDLVKAVLPGIPHIEMAWATASPLSEQIIAMVDGRNDGSFQT